MADFTIGTGNIPLIIKFRDEEGEEFSVPSNATSMFIKLLGQSTATKYTFPASIQTDLNGRNNLQYLLAGNDITIADTYSEEGEYIDASGFHHYSNPPYPTIVVVAPIF